MKNRFVRNSISNGRKLNSHLFTKETQNETIRNVETHYFEFWMSDIIDIYVTFYQRCIEAHVKNPFQPKIETLTTTTTVSNGKKWGNSVWNSSNGSVQWMARRLLSDALYQFNGTGHVHHIGCNCFITWNNMESSIFYRRMSPIIEGQRLNRKPPHCNGAHILFSDNTVHHSDIVETLDCKHI